MAIEEVTTAGIPDVHVSIVVYPDAEQYAAHCLEMDIVTTAPSVDEAVADVLDLIAAHLTFAYQNDNTDYIYRPAPPEIWRMFAEAQRRARVQPQSAACPPRRQELPLDRTRDSKIEADSFCYA